MPANAPVSQVHLFTFCHNIVLFLILGNVPNETIAADILSSLANHDEWPHNQLHKG